MITPTIYAIVQNGHCKTIHLSFNTAVADMVYHAKRLARQIIKDVESGQELDWRAWNLCDTLTRNYADLYLGELDFHNGICPMEDEISSSPETRNNVKFYELEQVKSAIQKMQTEYRATHKEPEPFEDYHTL